MKKITLLGLMLVSSLTYSQIYVDADASGANDGTSWADAYTSLSNAVSNAADNDDIWIADGDYSSSGTLNLLTGKSLYGGFVGTESNLNDRVLSDRDGNGITEPWEFTNETKYTSTKLNIAITNLTGTIDGLTIVHTFDGTIEDPVLENVSNASVDILQGGTVKNCVFENSVIKGIFRSTWNAGKNRWDGQDRGAGIVNCAGDFMDNLIQGNTIEVTNYGNNKIGGVLLIEPETGVTAYDLQISGNIFRNNNVTINGELNPNTGDNAAAPSNDVTTTNSRGVLINVICKNEESNAKIEKNIIHNNTATYIQGAGNDAGDRVGAVLSTLSFSKSETNIFLSNNTIAKNNSIGAGPTIYLYKGSKISYQVENNVLWGNEQDGALSSFRSNAAQLAESNIDYNITDVATVGNTTVAFGVNNLTDLSTSNISGNAPLFKTISTVLGASADASVNASDWQIPLNSYLTGKGTTIAGLTTDKAGNLFAANPAVGAYENDGSLSDNAVISTDVLTITKNGFASSQAGTIRLIKLNGQVVASQSVTAGEYIKITTPGIYIIQLTTASGSIAVKAIF